MNETKRTRRTLTAKDRAQALYDRADNLRAKAQALKGTADAIIRQERERAQAVLDELADQSVKS
jgi:hypothetical protein